MKATIIKIQKKPSRYGGFFYYVFFKDSKGKSFYSCIYPKMRNFLRWKTVLIEGIVLKKLRILKNRLIDADSNFVIEKN